MPPCSEPGCESLAIVLRPGSRTNAEAQYRPLCSRHQSRLQRTGDTSDAAMVRGPLRRRSSKELAVIDHALSRICQEEHPLNVRGAFYRLLSTTNLIVKSDQSVELVERRILGMRRGLSSTGLVIPGHWIRDSLRKITVPNDVYEDLSDYRARPYRRDIWVDQPVRVIVISEKDAVTTALQPVIEELHLRYGFHRGGASESFCYDLGQMAAWDNRPMHLIQLGDYDRAGIIQWDSIRDRVTRFAREAAPDVELIFERLAVTKEQLPTIQTRSPKADDVENGRWPADQPCAEVDAIAPSELRRMLRERVYELLDHDLLEQTRADEAEDLARLEEALGDED